MFYPISFIMAKNSNKMFELRTIKFIKEQLATKAAKYNYITVWNCLRGVAMARSRTLPPLHHIDTLSDSVFNLHITKNHTVSIKKDRGCKLIWTSRKLIIF